MQAFLLRKVIQKLAYAGVLNTCRGLFIESASFDFDSACLLANRVESEWTHQPHRCALDESFHVLAANQGYVLTKFLLIEFDQTTPIELEAALVVAALSPGVVAVADREAVGTTMLASRSPAQLRPAFGVGSFARHLALDAHALERKHRSGIADMAVGDMGLDREQVHGR